MISTIRLVSTIVFIGFSETNTIGYIARSTMGGGTTPLVLPRWRTTALGRMRSSCLRLSLLVDGPSPRTHGQGWPQARC
jgi:hypothetical protein